MRIFGSGGGDATVGLKNVDMAALSKECVEAAQRVGVAKRKIGEVDALVYETNGYTGAKRMRESDMDVEASSGLSVEIDMDTGATVPPAAKATDKSGAAYLLQDPAALNQARGVIDTQFSLEILMKHNELRRVEQELAKSQIALEQLRRCHLMPYPVSQGNPADMLNVSCGTGPSIPQARGTRPKLAPPFGVVESPYNRHYAKWLIPDPEFDGVQPKRRRLTETARNTLMAVEGRTTRNSLAVEMEGDKPLRGTKKHEFHSVPTAQSKENAGPCLVRRPDGQWVKLDCIDCNRDNFSSTQGFINHCRIAHRREFKSHEEAAAQSGKPVQVDDLGNIIGSGKDRSRVDDLVHPTIRKVPRDDRARLALLSRIADGTRWYYEGKLSGISSIPCHENTAPSASPNAGKLSGIASHPNKTATPSTTKPSPKAARAHKDFAPATATPHLSDLLRVRGFSKNLDAIVTDAQTKTPPDLDDDTPPAPGDLDSDMELDPLSAPLPSSFAAAFPRPPSTKGHIATRKPGTPTHLPYGAAVFDPAQCRRGSSGSAGCDHDDLGPDAEMRDVFDLSPTTVPSNNAPSLVSDDGEYSAADDDDGASSIDGGAERGGDESDDVAEIEFDDEGKAVARKGVEGAGLGFRKGMQKKQGVGFVSPVKGGVGRGG